MKALRAVLKNERSALTALLVIGLLVRLVFLAIYHPIELADSQAYRTLADEIRRNDFSQYTGIRTPGYPLFILACFGNAWVIWAAQALAGVATSAVVFRMALNQCRRVLPAFIAGLVTSLSLHLICFEALVMTETLSAFLMAWALLLLQPYLMQQPIRKGRSVALGALLAFAVMVRPASLFLVPFVLAGTLLSSGRWLQRGFRAVAFLLPLVLVVGGWSTFNWVKADYFGPSTITGIQLCTHNVDFIEAAPDEFADMRDAMMKRWPDAERRAGKQRSGVWEVYPAVRERSGETYGAFSRRMTRMHLELVKRRPAQYLSQVYQSWNQFWTPHRDYIQLRNFHPGVVAILMEVLVTEERRLLGAVNAIFVLGSLLLLAGALLRRKLPPLFDLAVILVVLGGAVFHAFTCGNDNSRYAVPFLPLVFYSVVRWGWELARPWLTRLAEPEPLPA